MKYKNLVLVVIGCCLLGTKSIWSIPDFLRTPTDAPLSADEETAMRQTQQLYDLITKDMPPEARAEFDQSASMQYERLSKMTPEELQQEQENVFKDLDTALQQMEEKEKATAPVPTPIAPPTKPKPRKPQTKIDALKEVIDTIIKRTEAMLLKTNQLLKLPQKVTSWAQSRQLSPWQAGLDWHSLKGDINTLKAQLTKIKFHDEQRRYLDAILENKKLRRNLEDLGDMLSMLEPQFVVTGVLSLDKQDLSRSSAQALKAILNSLLEALYTHKITDNLNKVMAKFDPEAEKLRKAREVEAEAAKKRTVRPAPPAAGSYYDYPAYSSGVGSGAQYGTGYTAPTSYQQPTYPRTRDSAYDRPSTTRDGRHRYDRGAPKTTTTDRGVTVLPDTVSTRLTSEISSILSEAVDLIEITPALSDLGNHLENETASIDAVNAFKRLNSKIRRATSKVKFLGRKKIARNKQELTDIVDEHKETLDALKRNIDMAAANVMSYDGNTQYAYFKMPVTPDTALQRDIPSPVDIRKTSKAISKFYEEANKIIGK